MAPSSLNWIHHHALFSISKKFLNKYSLTLNDFRWRYYLTFLSSLHEKFSFILTDHNKILYRNSTNYHSKYLNETKTCFCQCFSFEPHCPNISFLVHELYLKLTDPFCTLYFYSYSSHIQTFNDQEDWNWKQCAIHSLMF